MTKLNVKGFSMIELLVVLLIIGILAAIAAPFFLQNADKTRASEAVTGAGSIRTAERNYLAQNNSGYFQVAATDGETYFGTEGGNQSTILGVTFNNMKYFSPAAYSVTVPGTWAASVSGVSTTPSGYVIDVTGASPNTSLATDPVDGAANAGDVSNIRVEMDNSGQTIWSSNGGSSWSKY